MKNPNPPILDSNSTSERTRLNDLLRSKRWLEAREVILKDFDDRDAEIACCLGFLYDQKESPLYDLNKAIECYEVAAGQGNVYAQHSLGGIMLEAGRIDRAIEWYKKASSAGDGDCSYQLYRLYKTQNNLDRAHEFLRIACDQGNPLAVQKQSIKYILGRFGVQNMFVGVRMYFLNIPKLVRFIRENVH